MVPATGARFTCTSHTERKMLMRRPATPSTRCARTQSGIEFARLVIDAADGTGDRRAIHVHVPHRKKNADAPAGHPVKGFLEHFYDVAIGGRDHRVRSSRHHAVRVAKKIE